MQTTALLASMHGVNQENCRKTMGKITNPAREGPKHAGAAEGHACSATPRRARRSSAHAQDSPTAGGRENSGEIRERGLQWDGVLQEDET